MSSRQLDLQEKFKSIIDPEKAHHLQRFSKAGVGKYGEGDHCLGIRVPCIRCIARKFNSLSLEETEKLSTGNFPCYFQTL